MKYIFGLVILALMLYSCDEIKSSRAYIPLDFKTVKSGSLYVPEGWEAVKWAESPMFFNPTNMDVDYKGRIWITEAVNYRDFNNQEEGQRVHEKGDRVVILEDTDHDGKADKSTVFVQDSLLVAPLGIAVIGNKVLVSCAPNLLIYTDEDGDDVPDKREVFLTGFGGYDHDHSLHSVVTGPDGRWYFSTGNAGPHVVTGADGWTLRSGSLYTGGTPYNKENQGNMVSDDGKVWVGGLTIRINPDGTGMKVVGHNFRNSYETALDSYGNMWQNDNDDQVVTCRTTWLMEGGNAGFFSADGTRTWQYDRRPYQSNFTAHWHQQDPGVIPAGDNAGAGSPTGMLVYEGDLFGDMYRGMVLSVEAGKNVVYGYQPKPVGAGYQLDRKDLISSHSQVPEEYIWHEEQTDSSMWFRPSDAVVGTDGAIYVADWFDPIVGGHQMNEIEGYGVIYKIIPKGSNPQPPEIDLTDKMGMLRAFLSPAVNVKAIAYDYFSAKGDDAVSAIKPLLNSKNPAQWSRATWLMAALGNKGLSEVEKRLSNRNPEARYVALRALRQHLDQTQLLENLKKLSKDTSIVVKREVALALREFENLSLDELSGIISHLLEGFDGRDPWFLEALGMALEGRENEIWPVILNRAENTNALEWDNLTASLAWRLHPVAAVDGLYTRAAAAEIAIDERKRMTVALGFIKDVEAVRAMEQLAKSDLTDVARHAQWWLQFRKTNEWNTLKEWETEEVQFANMEVLAEEDPGFTFEEALALTGDKDNGKGAFDRACSSCHVFKETGKDIGPDLSRINRKLDRNTLIGAIMYPNQGLVFGYELWSINTRDGKSYSGMLLADGETVVLKDLTGNRIAVPAEEITGKKQLPGSIMPNPKGLGLTAQEVADIAGYLLE